MSSTEKEHQPATANSNEQMNTQHENNKTKGKSKNNNKNYKKKQLNKSDAKKDPKTGGKMTNKNQKEEHKPAQEGSKQQGFETELGAKQIANQKQKTNKAQKHQSNNMQKKNQEQEDGKQQKKKNQQQKQNINQIPTQKPVGEGETKTNVLGGLHSDESNVGKKAKVSNTFVNAKTSFKSQKYDNAKNSQSNIDGRAKEGADQPHSDRYDKHVNNQTKDTIKAKGLKKTGPTPARLNKSTKKEEKQDGKEADLSNSNVSIITKKDKKKRVRNPRNRKEKVQLGTRLVVRRLPPDLKEEEFLSDLPEDLKSVFQYFKQGVHNFNNPFEEPVLSRAYFQFPFTKEPENIALAKYLASANYVLAKYKPNAKLEKCTFKYRSGNPLDLKRPNRVTNTLKNDPLYKMFQKNWDAHFAQKKSETDTNSSIDTAQSFAAKNVDHVSLSNVSLFSKDMLKAAESANRESNKHFTFDILAKEKNKKVDVVLSEHKKGTTNKERSKKEKTSKKSKKSKKSKSSDSTDASMQKGSDDAKRTSRKRKDKAKKKKKKKNSKHAAKTMAPTTHSSEGGRAVFEAAGLKLLSLRKN